MLHHIVRTGPYLSAILMELEKVLNEEKNRILIDLHYNVSNTTTGWPCHVVVATYKEDFCDSNQMFRWIEYKSDRGDDPNTQISEWLEEMQKDLNILDSMVRCTSTIDGTTRVVTYVILYLQVTN